MNNTEHFKFFETDYDKEDDITTVTFSIPIREKFCGQLTDETVCQNIMSALYLRIAAISKFISGEAFEMLNKSNNSYYIQNRAELLMYMGEFSERLAIVLSSVRDYQQFNLYAEEKNTDENATPDYDKEIKDKTEETGDQKNDSETAPLDLSEVCQEFLGTNEATAHLEQEDRQTANDSEKIYWQSMAKKLSHILEHQEVSEETKRTLEGILDESVNESGVYLYEADLLPVSLPLIMDRVNPEYSKAVAHSLRAVIQNLSQEVMDELEQFKKPIDSQSVGGINELACLLSAIMKNPLLPERLYDVISEEISSLNKANIFTPENVLHNLELLRDRAE